MRYHPPDPPAEACLAIPGARDLTDAGRGVLRALAYALTHGMPGYAPPSAQFLETGQLLPGEPHSAYHEFVFKLIRLKDRLYTLAGRKLAEPRHAVMTAFFESLKEESQEGV